MNDNHFENLIKISERLILSEHSTFKRYIYKEINFDARLIIIKGCRGVGKSTLLRQYLKTIEKPKAYFSLDHIYFIENKLIEVVDKSYDNGYRIVILDEVHKYEGWSIELKNIYDSYPDLQVLVTSSSALDIDGGLADLSRRADVYLMRGLSFREYCELEYNVILPSYSFKEIDTNNQEVYDSVYEKFEIKKRFNRYLTKAYYPYYKESGIKYYDKILAVINQVIEIDIAAIFNIDYESTRQIKKLLFLIARISPFVPNVSKLARDLQMARPSVLKYLDFLESAGIINIIKSNVKSDSVLTKPDKIFMENTNLLYALGESNANVGTIRETFVVNALSRNHKISTPAKGDILLDDAYTIEIGGPNKDFHQIQNMANPVLIKDGIEKGSAHVIPMWMLGLLN